MQYKKTAFGFIPKFKIKLSGFTLLVSLFLVGFSLRASAQINPEKLFQKVKANLPHNTEKAEALTREYLEIGLELRSEKIKAKADYLFGLIHYYKSRFYISNKYYSKALNSPYAKTDESFSGSCWNNMGINYEIQNMFRQSQSAYQKSLRIAEKLKDSISIGQSWINLGLLNAKIQNYPKARKMSLTALKYFIEKNDSANIALCYQNLTYISSDEKDYQKALDYTFKGLEISLALHNEFDIAGSYYNLANNYNLMNNMDQSDYYLSKALEVSPEIGHREALLSKIYTQLGNNQRLRGNYVSAEKNLLYALDLTKKSGASENDYAAYQSLADLYAKSGNYEAYSRVINEYDKIKEQIGIQESMARADELQALYEFEKTTEKIEDQEKDIATQKKQVTILITLIIIILSILLIISVMHLRMRRYMRSLFENKVEQTKHDSLVSETVIENQAANKDLFSLYNQILAVMNDKRLTSELKLSDLSAELGTSEEDISQAIKLFGNKDYHTFLNTYYIDGICKKMIENGKQLPLKKLIADSPFTNYSAFYKQFKEITGLTPEQFMDYSEEKLQVERRQRA